MRRLLVLSIVVASLLVATPSAAAAKPCRFGYYVPGSPNGTLIKKLKITTTTQRIDGYAPPCLVAESVAYDATGTGKRRIHVYGARWDGGSYHCRSKLVYDRSRQFVRYTRMRCTHADDAYKATVTWQIHS
jgi:hypothetical protein